jgi:hypothetical protein
MEIRMPKSKPIPSVEELHSRYSYNPTTGMLTSKQTGKVVGAKTKLGYLKLRIDSAEFKLHRVVWKMMTGEEPLEIDHKNLKRTDNRWVNLRKATRTKNSQNKQVRPDSSTGLKGIIARPARNGRSPRYEAWIQVGTNRMYLGSSLDPIEAYQMYVEASKKYFRGFAQY